MPLGFVLLAAALLALALAALCLPLWRAAAGAPSSRRLPAVSAAVLALGLPAAAVSLYALLGAPGAAGGRAAESVDASPASATATATYAELQAHLRRQPDDARALIHKARLDVQAQRPDEAAAAYARALGGASKAARDPGVWVEYAEALGLAQGGRLEGRPREMVDKALAMEADHAGALDLAGSAAWEAGDFATAARHWQRLLAQLPPGSARHGELSAAIERAERRARLALPPLR